MFILIFFLSLFVYIGPEKPQWGVVNIYLFILHTQLNFQFNMIVINCIVAYGAVQISY